MKIVIGYDGSEVADAAIDSLALAGLPEHVSALVMSVAEVWLQPEGIEKAAQLARSGADRLKTIYPHWQVETATSEGSPGPEIVRRAKGYGADLIILGDHRIGAKQQMFLGSTSTKVLRESEASVRVSRGHQDHRGRPVRILIGFDGSAGSIGAVDEVCARTWPTGSSTTLLMIADDSVLSTVGRFAPQMSNATVEARLVKQWAETLAETSMSKLRDAGLAVDLHVESGYPKESLVTAADKLGVDEIFVGPNRGGNSFDRFLLGSVSVAVASRANCSVEVVRNQALH
jgi:nucleotide-binding universal stress UspA family protein